MHKSGASEAINIMQIILLLFLEILDIKKNILRLFLNFLIDLLINWKLKPTFMLVFFNKKIRFKNKLLISSMDKVIFNL